MKARKLPVLLLALGLSACGTQVPVDTGYPISYQHRVQAAYHWDQVADSVAERLALVMLGPPEMRGGKSVVLTLNGPHGDVPFADVYEEFLYTRLIQKGFGVSTTPGAGTQVDYQIQMVTHNDRGVSGSIGHTLDNEIVVTTYIKSGDRFVTRMNDIFYISDVNADQYLAAAPPAPGPHTKRMGVVGQ